MSVGVVGAPASAGGIKLVQRGVATAAGTVTITAVDTSKTFVNSYATESSGNVGLDTPNLGNNMLLPTLMYFGNSFKAANYGAYLTDATTLTVTGPCQWEVIEFA